MHVNKSNGKRYIGITSSALKTRWKRGAGYKGQRRFYNAIVHYGWDNFDHVIIASGLSKNDAERREENAIREYKSNDIRYGYNIENGGIIHKLSNEQKEHLRQINIGKRHSATTRLKMSNSHKGQSPQWLIGRKASDETKRKMSISQTGARNGRARAVVQYDLTGNVVARYEYMQLIKCALNINNTSHISRCCRGERKTAHGYKWAYAEE